MPRLSQSARKNLDANFAAAGKGSQRRASPPTSNWMGFGTLLGKIAAGLPFLQVVEPQVEAAKEARTKIGELLRGGGRVPYPVRPAPRAAVARGRARMVRELSAPPDHRAPPRR